MEFLADYGQFLARTITIAALVLAPAAAAVVMLRGRVTPETRVEIRSLNRKLESMTQALQAAMLPKKERRRAAKELQARRRAREKSPADARRRLFVLRFQGDLRASAVASLREEVTAVLGVARPQDEVVVVLESAGGTVHGYGLAASQLRRVRERGLHLTAAVDRIAASGGYMMACVADRVVAAPFAIIGSIGVVGQLPNFNRFLKKHDIDIELHTAGDYKRTLTLFGENTDQDRAKFREELDDAHRLFKEFVREHRPQVDIDAVATGEYWFGRRALDLGLVDELRASDDYLVAATAESDVYELSCPRRRTLAERLLGPGAQILERI